MTDKDILISDLNDISEILINNGYGGWYATIRKAVDLLKEHDGCIYNKNQDEQIKGRRMSDAESMGMLFDDPPDISVDAFIKWCSESHMMGNATLKGIEYWVGKYKEQL